MNPVSTNEYQFLLNELCAIVMNENVQLRDAMSRIELLLKDAVRLINESVSTAHTTIQTHQIMLDSAVNPENTNNPVEGLLDSLRKALTITVQLNAILTKTTRSLQVEDIVTQIITEVNTRSSQIDNVLRQLHNHSLSELNHEMIKSTLDSFEHLKITAHKSPIK